jgi:hypothetical protein
MNTLKKGTALIPEGVQMFLTDGENGPTGYLYRNLKDLKNILRSNYNDIRKPSRQIQRGIALCSGR